MGFTTIEKSCESCCKIPRDTLIWRETKWQFYREHWRYMRDQGSEERNGKCEREEEEKEGIEEVRNERERNKVER